METDDTASKPPELPSSDGEAPPECTSSLMDAGDDEETEKEVESLLVMASHVNVRISSPPRMQDDSPVASTSTEGCRRSSRKPVPNCPTGPSIRLPDSGSEKSADSDEDYYPDSSERVRTVRTKSKRGHKYMRFPQESQFKLQPIKIRVGTEIQYPNQPIPRFNISSEPSSAMNKRRQLSRMVDRHKRAFARLAQTVSTKSEDLQSIQLESSLTEDLINMSYQTLRLISSIKQSVSILENHLQRDYIDYVKSNNLERIVKRNEYVEKALFGDAPPEIDSEPVESSDKSAIYDALKKIEKSGVSWKNTNAKSDDNLNIMISDIHSQHRRLLMNKNITLKRVTVKKEENCFFQTDGRYLKPPDSWTRFLKFILV